MLLGLVAASWLLATSVSGSVLPVAPAKGARIINNRDQYLDHAKADGMCRPKLNETENRARVLVIPGPEVRPSFKECVAKNELHESLRDHSGDIFCQGLTIHLMADAMNHKDSKEFVDQASTLDGIKFNQDVDRLIGESLADEFTVEKFLGRINKDFGLRQPGSELHYYNNSRFPNTPDFVAQIRPKARLFRAWAKIVHHYWNNLDRTMMQTYGRYLIPGPGSSPHEREKDLAKEKYSTSLIRLEHPFVVAGGRFREQYYWDSFFIMEGLLAANMGYLARTTLLNFMDQIKAYGFIPNGGRKYYLNRKREIRWWYNNRTVTVLHNGQNHRVFRYNVKATGPRPESYAEDWRSVWCFSDKAPIRDMEKLKYSEFATGAESGWDYTARWMSDPFNQPNRTKSDQMNYLQITNIIPVDLNSIMYRCHKLMALLYQEARNNEAPFAYVYSQKHERSARRLRKSILALHWDPDNLAFFDFVLHEQKRGYSRTGYLQHFWSGASLVPYWAQIWPDALNCTAHSDAKQKVMGAFAGVRDLLELYPGPLPSTLVNSTQQWDFPNSWPPLQYFAIKALQNVNETCIDGTTTAEFEATTRHKKHLGEREPPAGVKNTPKVDFTTSPSWRDVLVKTVAMRYMNAAYCTWNNKGQLPDDRVEIVMRDNPVNDKNLYKHPGEMFEKLNALSPVAAGGGGEYEVQTGFGWTNGVAIWIARQFGAILDNPNCTDPTVASMVPKTNEPL
ncbi:hypothetical protein FRC12_023838, partial [Ceratobasidium sp. 428]